MTQPEITWQLLKRHIAGETTVGEQRAVGTWLTQAAPEEVQRVFTELARRDPVNERAHADFWAYHWLPGVIPNLSELRREAVAGPRPKPSASLRRKVLDRYCTGTATPIERQIAERWLATPEAFHRFMDRAGVPPLDEEEARRAAAEVFARLERGDRPAINVEVSRSPIPGYIDHPVPAPAVPRRSPRLLKAAAAITVLLGGPVLAWHLTQRAEERHAAAIPDMIVALAGRPPVRTVLPDRSVVIVSPGSTLRYPKAFGADHREVQLEGEAYFAVEHDASQPFIVHAGDLMAEDLGTEFIVRAYPEDQHGRVVVREGRVSINGTTIVPGELGRLDPNGTVRVAPADTAAWFAWTQGQLNLDGMRLGDVLPKLNRWYDLEFRLAEPSLRDIELLGDFPEQHLDDAPQRIAAILGLSVTRQGRVVTFHADPVDPS